MLALLAPMFGAGSANVHGQTAAVPTPIRIEAGIRKPLVDAEGNTWLADRGFVNGVIADRDVITSVANTRSPALYRSERYNMTAFTEAVLDGRYRVRLHFAEMYAPVDRPGLHGFNPLATTPVLQLTDKDVLGHVIVEGERPAPR